MSNKAEIFHLLQSVYLKRKSALKNNIGQKVISAELLPTLSYIAGKDGCTQKSIADELGITPSAVAQNAKKLEDAGLIRRFENSECRREKRLIATERGRLAVRGVIGEFDAMDSTAMSGLNDSELDTLQSLLAKINNNLDDLHSFGKRINPWD